MSTDFTVESYDIFRRHLRGPCGRGKDEDIGGSGIPSVRAKLLRFPGRLRSSSGNDQDVVEAIVIQRLARQCDRFFAFIMGPNVLSEMPMTRKVGEITGAVLRR